MSRLLDWLPESPAREPEAQPPPPPPAAQQAAEYLERCAKLIPVEVVGAFLLIRGFLQSGSGTSPWVHVAVYAALLLAVPAYLGSLARDVPKRRRQIAISVVAFIVWSYSIGGWFWPQLGGLLGVDLISPALGGILPILYSLGVGALMPKRVLKRRVSAPPKKKLEASTEAPAPAASTTSVAEK